MVGRPPPDIELGGAAARPARATVFSLGTIRRCPELGLGFMAGLAERLLPESGGGAVGRMFFGMLTGGNTTGVAEPLLGMQNKANHFPSKTAQVATSYFCVRIFRNNFKGWYSQALLKKSWEHSEVQHSAVQDGGRLKELASRCCVAEVHAGLSG